VLVRLAPTVPSLQTFLENLKTRFSDKPGLASDAIYPTVGLNIAKITLYNQVELTIWDLGGQVNLRSMWESYYSDAHAVIYLVDSSDKGRFNDVANVIGDVTRAPLLDAVPVLVLANKQDIGSAARPDELQQLLGLEAVNNGHQTKVMGVSALEQQGLDESMNVLDTLLRECPREIDHGRNPNR
jgi:ADP-ribosylation factor related protein 1